MVNKPKGISSFDVIRKLKSIFPRGTKLGHAGTLDPAASGLLLVLVEEATRIQKILKDLDKEYVAQVRLGVLTETLDAEGEIIEKSEVPELDNETIRKVLASLAGTRRQRPPRYSALKVGGRRAYDLARSGEDFELGEREITIHHIELLSYLPPILTISTRVSSGTYIRSLAVEIGHKIGVPASLKDLRRTRVGNFFLQKAIDLDKFGIESIRGVMIPIEDLAAHLPQEVMTETAITRLLQGKPLEEVDTRLLQSPSSIIFSPGHRQAFLCEPREKMLWSKRMIYNDGDGGA